MFLPLLQVHNGLVYDLLSRGDSQRALPVLDLAVAADTEDTSVASERERTQAPAISLSRGGCRVMGLSTHLVENAKQVMELLQQGLQNRRVRCTEVRNRTRLFYTMILGLL